ncbi:MAG: TonB-dependent receptor [Bacteroidota bacterium]|nr:TonB-dependent receptor [Bacteroidota bacterium]
MLKNLLQKRRMRSKQTRFLLILLCLAFFNIQLTFAQKVDVTGTVSDAKSGETLPGVSVMVEGSTSGTVTDIEGKFKISVSSSDVTLKFSYVGYEPQKIALRGQTQLTVGLIAESKTLDEVVVIGYGTSKRKDLTGSITSISGEKLKDVPVASVAEALTGKLAGVQVTTTEGSPDAAIKIRVRGGGSITQDNTPLYIVDGFPVDNLSNIPPTDIQSVDVLKDASSTAIYGSRGANGVVIITTKSAKEGKLTVNYSGYYSVKKVTKKLDVFSPYEFAKWQYEQAVLQNKVSSQYEPYFGSYDDIGLYKYMNGTNWQDEVFGRTGTTQNHSISVSGGTSSANFNASYTRMDDKAIMLGSSFSRDNLNLKVNSAPLSWLKMNFAVRYSDTKINGGGANDVTGTEKSTSDSRLKNAVIYTPIPLKNMSAPDDDPESGSSLYSPFVTIPDNDRLQRTKILNLSADATAQITKEISFRSEIAIDNTNGVDNRFYGLSTYYVTNGDAPVKNQPAAQLQNIINSGFRNANILNFNKKIGSHNVGLMVGEEAIVKKANTLTNIVDAYPKFFTSNQAWAFTSQGVAVSATNYYSPDDKMLSYFGRFNYDYKGKYLVNATFRADGSGKFGPGKRWGYFPSAAVAWRISQENFMSGTSEWLSNLKLRASFGTAGNNRIPGFMFRQSYPVTSTTYLPTSLASSYLAPSSTMTNADLKWETTVTQNLGLDFGVFNNRLNGTFEVYQNKTKDLLINFPITGVGYSTQLRNLGKTSNRGIELTLDAAVVDTKDFRLNLSFNISFNRNKVDDLGGLSSITGNSAWTSDAQASTDYLVTVGKPVGQMYGYVTDGMYSTKDFTWNGSAWKLNNKSVQTPDNSSIDGSSWGPGALKLRDLNGDSVISPNDRQVIGNAMPKHTGGFVISGYFKGFDFSANFNWVYGNDIYNANKIEFTTANKYTYRNMLSVVNSSNRWNNVDPTTGARLTDATALDALNANAKIWSPGLGKYVFHSWAVEDGSFLRLNNVTLGYTLPKKWMTKLYVQQLRFYVSAYNLFVWTKYSGYDPEVDTRRSTPLTPGVDYSAYPRSRAYNFGVNLTF